MENRQKTLTEIQARAELETERLYRLCAMSNSLDMGRFDYWNYPFDESPWTIRDYFDEGIYRLRRAWLVLLGRE